MHNVGINSNGGAPPLRFRLLPERLKQVHHDSKAWMVGKWHIGYSWRRYTPTYRGFDGFFGYYNGDEDYYNHTFPTGNAAVKNGRCHVRAVDYNNNTQDTLQTLGDEFTGKYSARTFAAEVVRIINMHNVSHPLFLYVPMQSVHGPWEAPAESIAVHTDPGTPHYINDTKRQVYAGMLGELDAAVANITTALRRRGLWHNRTLFVLTSDNGGPGQGGSPPNNCYSGYTTGSYDCKVPLRGGKATLWEGGVRVLGFVASPGIPVSRRGGSWSGISHASDWMPSYVKWFGGDWPPPNFPDDPRGEPMPFDGHDILPAIFADSDSPRDEVVLSVINPHNPPGYPKGPMSDHGFPYSCAASSFCGGALRRGSFKLLVGYPGWHQLYSYPNNTHLPLETNFSICRDYCLFNVEDDPSESHDLARDPLHATVVRSMLDRFWNLSNASGGFEADEPFTGAQCPGVVASGVWQPLDHNNSQTKLQTKPGRGGCGGEQNLLLSGKGYRSLSSVVSECRGLRNCVYFIWSQDAGQAWFCTVDGFDEDSHPEKYPHWTVGHFVSTG